MYWETLVEFSQLLQFALINSHTDSISALLIPLGTNQESRLLHPESVTWSEDWLLAQLYCTFDVFYRVVPCQGVLVHLYYVPMTQHYLSLLICHHTLHGNFTHCLEYTSLQALTQLSPAVDSCGWSCFCPSLINYGSITHNRQAEFLYNITSIWLQIVSAVNAKGLKQDDGSRKTPTYPKWETESQFLLA